MRSERDETTLLLKALEKVDSYLSESGAKYLVGDTLHKADCYLLPTLQHIRVAGKVAFQLHILSELIFTTKLKLLKYCTRHTSFFLLVKLCNFFNRVLTVI